MLLRMLYSIITVTDSAPSVGFKLGRHVYSSIPELIESNAALLRKSVPYFKFGLSRYFHGFIDFDEAKRRLQGKPLGTYLVRFRYYMFMKIKELRS